MRFLILKILLSDINDLFWNPASLCVCFMIWWIYTVKVFLREFFATLKGELISIHDHGSRWHERSAAGHGTHDIEHLHGADNCQKHKLNELSLDNIIDLGRAVEELGNQIPIAGNVDPVEVVMNGSREEIHREALRCIEIGQKAEKGYGLATGCDVPETAKPVQIDWMMEAVREYCR